MARSKRARRKRKRARKARRVRQTPTKVLRRLVGAKKKIRRHRSKGGTVFTTSRGRAIDSESLAALLAEVPTAGLRGKVTIRGKTKDGEWISLSGKTNFALALDAAQRTLTKIYEEEEFVQLEIFESD